MKIRAWALARLDHVDRPLVSHDDGLPRVFETRSQVRQYAADARADGYVVAVVKVLVTVERVG